MALLIAAAFALVLLNGGGAGLAPGIIHVAALVLAPAALIAAGLLYDRAAHLSRQKRLLEEELAQKNFLLDAVPDAFFSLGREGRILQRKGLEKLLDAARIAAPQDVMDRLLPAAAEALQQHLKETQAGREEEFRIQLSLKNGNRTLAAAGLRRNSAGGPVVFVWLRDITRFTDEIRRQSDVLHQANNQIQEFRALLEALPFPAWLRGPDLRLGWVNAAYAAAVGGRADTVVLEQMELVPPAERGKGPHPAQLAADLGNARMEQRHVVIEGQRRLLHIVESCVGGPRQLVGYAVDITQEAELEAELKRHIRTHEEVLDLIGTPIAIYGADMRLKFFNRAYQKLWDADEEFLKSEPGFGEILEDLRARRRAPEQADFQKYKKERVNLFTSLIEAREDLMHLPDGATLRIMALPHPFGGLMFVHEDVTDRLALESSYNTLIAVQRETLDNLAEGIAVFGGDGKLRLYNPAFQRVWKLEDARLAGHPHFADVLELMKPLIGPGPDWSAFKRVTIAETLDRTPRAGRHDCTDGTVIEYSSVPLPDGAVLISYVDVSDSVHAEQALRESNAALAAADRLKSEFVANVSYQLRTPLNTIIGFSEILANQYFGTLNARQMEYAQTIMEASKKLLNLINDVLDLATIEAGRMALNCKSVSIRPLLESAADMTAEWARQKNVSIVLAAGEDAGAFEVDEHRVRQVLFNLVSNAIQYSREGGHIRLSAAREGDWVALTVEDDGLGIPEEDQDRVFGKFERANPGARQSGAGLGLALVKSFVELHGGRVTISSRKDEGARITCYLPIHAQEPQKISA